MGCTSSKQVKSTVDAYRPAPASFAAFNINTIQEPWLMPDDTKQQQKEEEENEKPTHVPKLILEKLNTFDQAPHTWDEVSKALEDLKPTLQFKPPPPATSPKPDPAPPSAQDSTTTQTKKLRRKSFSFHTLDELEVKVSTKPKPAGLRKVESLRNISESNLKKTESNKDESRVGVTEEPIIKPVRENIFIVRERLEREREGKEAKIDKMRRDPLNEYPEKCPPGGADSVVLYTTSLRGVRRTYEDCNRARSVMELHRVVFDERDVSLHSGFLIELKELLGEGVTVPRLFVKGRYVGGVEEVVELNETSRIGRLLNSARVERGVGRQACEGCGGARFVPCLECGGSCKVLVGDKKEKERCSKCNENGLVHCPICL